jgi:hypothetical protein
MINKYDNSLLHSLQNESLQRAAQFEDPRPRESRLLSVLRGLAPLIKLDAKIVTIKIVVAYVGRQSDMIYMEKQE